MCLNEPEVLPLMLPEAVIFVAIISVTVIEGVPAKPVEVPVKLPIKLWAWLLLTNKDFQYFVGEPKSTSSSLLGNKDPDASNANNTWVEPEV